MSNSTKKNKLPKAVLETLSHHWTASMFGFMVKAYTDKGYFRPEDDKHIKAIKQLLSYVKKMEGGELCK